jgi:hypothetical protein
MPTLRSNSPPIIRLQKDFDTSPDTHRNAPQPDHIVLHSLISNVARGSIEGTNTNAYHGAEIHGMVRLSGCAFGNPVIYSLGNAPIPA